MNPPTLLVIAKEPLPGRVKTRLTPAFSPAQAAALAEAALADTLRTLAGVPAARRVLVLDGAPGPWLPAGFDVVPQARGPLDERIAAAFSGCRSGPAVLVGMDTPQLTSDLLTRITWDSTDAWFGPAADGGFWALGLRTPARADHLVRGVPMSTPHTGARQRRRLLDAGLVVRDLPVLRDVDTAEDARHVATLCSPDSHFAAALRALPRAVR
ncbi:DUF2064 domain-containing protein [Streptomyces sp. NPDC017943]|uniref:TIGR04282 family arsenosugar biosynthesis glycosyltransferase n=1 Tax=Streptomyces sp. NPDC017943 TaxID=3365019 RepID=UPI0037B240FD